MNKQQPTLLVTGGAGFIGANFITYYMEKYPNSYLLNIDKLTYAGSTANLSEVAPLPNYHFINGDITDEALVSEIFADFDITGVIHFAAESHVDRSIQDSKAFVETNVVGTLNLLQAAKRDWEKKDMLAERRFHHISTDEVYGSLGEQGKFSEDTPYDPRNPYSASKAGANMLVKSFGHTYGMNIVISSSSNNYGPRQHEEKLIPTIIKKALAGEPIPIYGDGQNVRDWIYVNDHCRAIDTIYHQGNSLETYNVGGSNEKTNIEIAEEICQILDKLAPEYRTRTSSDSFKDLITFTEDRKGHDRRYAVDDRKLRNELGWKPTEDLKTGLQNTVDWYVTQWKTHLTH
ncbi:dTDP-glucose 4,6-dehydratase [Virgibacillus natechei]|uniref:dTDP-glucose 4,6-dehydratase n=1 Tax=Virgibacillus natechei TaxID=1216297 RepID=A0ABS4IIE9_9BACI|nr:dTDP-glucose 4,6-dehydratase [Virgibacillus natechei]MBP1970695.1 dTDP-glucose 4,6-dehydratase [Virgibacillus natechei]UZD12060.1 dTDP-glucose 4,6-dehydratase [Virgibacillus natechei]